MSDSLPYTISNNLSITVEEVSEEKAVGRMKVEPGVLNRFGRVHAGALVWLADVTATVMAQGKVGVKPGEPGFPLAIDLHTTLVGNVTAGEVIAEARVVKRGRRVTVIRTRLTSDQGRLLAELTSTHVPA